jgi:hypothetical protein
MKIIESFDRFTCNVIRRESCTDGSGYQPRTLIISSLLVFAQSTMSLSTREKLAPLNPNGASDGETHSRTTSTTTKHIHSPSQSPSHRDSYPFPDATHTVSTSVSTSVSLSASLADLPPGPISRPVSRSTHASGQLYMDPSRLTSSPARPRSREPFASPRTRPMTIYSTVQPSITKTHRERPKSTMLTSTSVLEKPWLTSRDPYSRIAYFITYGVMFLGIAAGAVRCYFGWLSVPLLSGNLCLVLDENFDTDNGLFGENGTFFREVDMSGFGYVSLFRKFPALITFNPGTDNSK